MASRCRPSTTVRCAVVAALLAPRAVNAEPPDGALVGATAKHGTQTLYVTTDLYPAERAVLHVTGPDGKEQQAIELPGDSVRSSVIAISGDRAVISLPNAPGHQGAVVVLAVDRRGHWLVEHSFHGREWFGISVAIAGDRLAIGDRDWPGTDDGWGPGAVHLYRLRAGRWRLTQELRPSDPAIRGFGYRVVLTGARLQVQSIWNASYDEVDRVAVYRLRGGVARYERSFAGGPQ